MTGLNKIIERILLDAKERARETLESAQRDCRRAAEDFAAHAEEIRDDYAARLETDAQELVESAARDTVANHEKTLADARKALIDQAFDAAVTELRRDDFGKYRELLTALLTSALIDLVAKQKQAGIEPDQDTYYEVMLSKSDRAAYGESVINGARRAAYRHIGAARNEKVYLSDETPNITGGVHLRYGDELIDCSLETILRELRAVAEPRIAAILFPESKA
ncbi:MAG: hypothetical protein IJC99_05420 [Clostridia bacterium]|nr:hypothetical protein [Clostridia bacterium]